MKRVKIQGYIPEELKEWVEQMIKEGVFRSEAHAVEQGLRTVRQEMRGTVLDK